jgi:alpha-tubulin suppressor-like RCC1 family protein
MPFSQDEVEEWGDIVQAACGSFHTVGLKSDGTVVVVGYNFRSQCDVEEWTDIVQVAANGNHTVGLKSDGTVVTVGNNDAGQCDVEDWNLRTSPKLNIHTLTQNSPNITIVTGDTAKIYGGTEINHVTLRSGAIATLINFPGNNIITIQADSSLFTVFRSGSCVTFEGTDGTFLKMPATTTAQIIVFNDKSESLIIDSGRVLLGNQEINLTPTQIED